MSGRPLRPALQFEERKQVSEWRRLLEEHTINLLGPRPPHRGVRVMVTMPSEAADDYNLVRALVSEGMDCMRINCAHDGIEAWDRMVTNLHRARKETGRECRILMDLPGPKLRTGPITPGPRVAKWRPIATSSAKSLLRLRFVWPQSGPLRRRHMLMHACQ